MIHYVDTCTFSEKCRCFNIPSLGQTVKTSALLRDDDEDDVCACTCAGRLSKRVDDVDEMLTSADESELDPLQWNDADNDAMSNSHALDADDDADGVEWSKELDRDSASPTSHKRGARVRGVVVALLVVLVIAGACAAVLLLHRRMQGHTRYIQRSSALWNVQYRRFVLAVQSACWPGTSNELTPDILRCI